MVSTKLAVFMAIGSALSMVAAAPIWNMGENGSRLLNQDVCDTPECIATAESFLGYMNPNADPCDDFTEFTCGAFYEKTVVDANTISVDFQTIISNRNKIVIREIADAALGKAPKPAPGDKAAESNLKKLHDMYASCMDVDAIQTAGQQPLTKQVQSVLSLIPDTPAIDKAALAKTMAQLIKQEVIIFYNIGVEQQLYNPHYSSIQGKQGGLTLPITSYNQSLTDAADLVPDIAQQFQKVLGVTVPSATNGTTPEIEPAVGQEWTTAAQDVIAFETLLADVTAKNTRPSLDPELPIFNNPITVEELSNATPSIDWPLLLSELLPVDVKYDRPLSVQSPEFLPALETLLSSTSVKTLRNYFAWRIISAQKYRLNTAAIPGHERWEVCNEVVTKTLPDIVGHYFVERTLPESDQTVFRTMLQSIISAYGEGFPTLNWIDQITLDGALKKLHAMGLVVGQSAESPNGASSESVEEYYSGFDVDVSDYFGNWYKQSVWATEKSFATVNEPYAQKKIPQFSPTEVNAIYLFGTNHIYAFAGIMQSPMFHASNPEYINFAGLGGVAGHEIGHGFDNSGKKFDSTGNFTNWWTPETEKAFAEKAQCFNEQYSNYTIKGPDGTDLHLDGPKTLGENIADNGGIKYAFRAWQSRLKADPTGKKYKNFKLPGFEKYTPEQLFFISYGKVWCSKEIPEYSERLIKTDEHSLNKFRILGSLQNSVEFAEAFKCAPRTRMNPEKKCSLW
ncbi:hypothetical protein EC957_004740 [Mortierella hygrophila]|uniref:Zincin n=1 Tax=Mortierella hygrophila TaxID=979708 RepID=A0A9P6FF31_9FUNG|nr:hypothetical protein EC957_004740 [Mortierella hygrophila]